MIMQGQPEPEKPTENEGGSGGRSMRTESGRTEIQDGRMTATAIRRGWLGRRWRTREPKEKLLARTKGKSMTAKDRAMLTAHGLMESDSDRSQGIGAKCVIAMEAHNANIEAKLLDKMVPDRVEVSNTSESRLAVEQLHADPDYVEYLRYRTVTADCDPGAVCQIREPGHDGAVENGTPPGGSGPGTNGHRNGKE